MPAVQDVLAEFDEYLALQCGRSEHTRRAYRGDLLALFDFTGGDLADQLVGQLADRAAGQGGCRYG